MNYDVNRDLAMSVFAKVKLSVDPETKNFLDRCHCGWVHVFTPENQKHFKIAYPKGIDFNPEWLVIRVKESLLSLGFSLLAVKINNVNYCYYLNSDGFRHTGKFENGKFREYLGKK